MNGFARRAGERETTTEAAAGGSIGSCRPAPAPAGPWRVRTCSMGVIPVPPLIIATCSTFFSFEPILNTPWP